MKKKMRQVLMCILFVIFLGSTALMLRQWMDNAGGETTYQDAMDLAVNSTKETAPAEKQTEATTMPTEKKEPVTAWVPAPVENDPVMEEMAAINLAALREVNEDVLGWIRIPDTKIDYPLMHGDDNDFYLHHTWERESNSVGSIFLEHTNAPNLTDFNTIIYGHNMNNGSMFAELEHFALQKHWQGHPYVYIVTDAGVYRYEIFAFYRADVDSLTYSLNPTRDDTKEKFFKLALDTSWIDTGIQPEITDRVLTLSTCSGADYSSRYVVQARLPMMEVTK